MGLVPRGTSQPECKFCNKIFKKPEDVQSHVVEQHTRQTDALQEGYTCPKCDHIERDSYKLYTTHILDEHNIENLFNNERESGECPECNDILSDEHGMIQHYAAKHASNTTDSSYICTLCGEINKQVDKIENHIRQKHKPTEFNDYFLYNCPECTTREKHSKQLRKHYNNQHKNAHIECPKCNEQFTRQSQQRKQYWYKHHNSKIYDAHTTKTVPRTDTLDYLYNINKHAKKYKKLGTENYRKGKKTTAKANSLKKEALYEIKEKVLQQIYHHAKTLSVHIISGNKFYFIDFGKYSFHSPIETLSIPQSEIEGTKTLKNFHSGSAKEKSNASLKQSLKFFNQTFNENANNHLTQTHLSYGHQSYFIGWEYLTYQENDVE